MDHEWRSRSVRKPETKTLEIQWLGLSVCLSVCLFICQLVSVLACWLVRLLACLLAYLFVSLSCCLFDCLFVIVCVCLCLFVFGRLLACSFVRSFVCCSCFACHPERTLLCETRSPIGQQAVKKHRLTWTASCGTHTWSSLFIALQLAEANSVTSLNVESMAPAYDRQSNHLTATASHTGRLHPRVQPFHGQSLKRACDSARWTQPSPADC